MILSWNQIWHFWWSRPYKLIMNLAFKLHEKQLWDKNFSIHFKTFDSTGNNKI